ncbi:signal transduction histidine kinase [Sphingomonas jejuensis]|uniref:histidine kinase n=1 Tax=Sphingomonas jejuensis TaxID=904715 RepID=A0ABX0XLT9_9SPHN|nr:ATP-binding protein [Sphingomonas jejuensis]NJC34210.1 signal transduction histidine kinase [Sphingomonas jejuensis]
MSYVSPLPSAPRVDFRRYLGWLAAALGMLSVIAIILLVSNVSAANRQRDAALAEQQRSFGVMLQARSLESTLTKAEAALGRYVLSSDIDVGRFYYQEWRRAGAIIDRLERDTREDPAQQAMLRRLRLTYDERGRELSQSALRTAYGQGMNGIGLYHQAARAESLQQMADLLNDLIASERRNLSSRSRDATELVNSSNRIASRLSMFGILLILGAGLLAWLTARAVGQRRLADRDMEASALRAEVLEEAVALRTAELSDANERLRAEAAERAAAEAQLRQAHKMEAVGKLTGGIAHDFNNMLAVVTGGLELARRRIHNRPTEAMQQIDKAMEGAVRAAALTRRLLAFSRAEPLMPAAHDPAALIAGMTDLLDRSLGEQIRVHTDLAPGAWPIWVDRLQLENAILNLAVNARDAMERGGILTIRTANRLLSPGHQADLDPGDYLAIEVSDDGCGMSAEVLDRVFEPFFTTKPVGLGTGLGLSQVFGFVGQSSGKVLIASAPGRGTTVTLLLPRYTGLLAVPADAAPARPVEIDATGRTILVIEDDARVLSATVDTLIELGHRPIACNRPERAADLLAASGPVDLILSDVVMAGMSGPELVSMLVRQAPDAAVLFVTGFTGEADEADFGGYPVLRKPFSMRALELAVDSACDQRPGVTPIAA